MYDLANLKEQLATLDAQRAPLVTLIQAIEAYEASVGKTVPASPRPTFRLRTRPATMLGTAGRTVGLALELIATHGRPVSTGEVIAAMRAKGLPLPDKNATNVVSARLSNSSLIKGHRGVGWWPADKPLPSDGMNGEPSLPIEQALSEEAQM